MVSFQIGLRFFQNLLDPLRVWVIRYFIGAEGVAVFQVGLRFFGYLTQLIFAASTPLLSIMSEEFARSKEKAAKVTGAITKYFTWISPVYDDYRLVVYAGYSEDFLRR